MQSRWSELNHLKTQVILLLPPPRSVLLRLLLNAVEPEEPGTELGFLAESSFTLVPSEKTGVSIRSVLAVSMP